MNSRCKRRSLSQNSTRCTLDNQMASEDVYSISSDACADKMPMCSHTGKGNCTGKNMRIGSGAGTDRVAGVIKIGINKAFHISFYHFFLKRITYHHERCPFVQKEKNEKTSLIKISPLEK